MTRPLDEAYFSWLYSQVSSLRVTAPTRTHNNLLRQLFRKEFVWFVANDDNRVEDGKFLRVDFMRLRRVQPDDEWLDMGCSFLEMLIALSRRLAFEAEGKASSWFWRLIEHLELEIYTDFEGVPEEYVNDILDRVIWRTYRPDGVGGLFPLKAPTRDQRNIEIWDQMSDYIYEESQWEEA